MLKKAVEKDVAKKEKAIIVLLKQKIHKLKGRNKHLKVKVSKKTQKNSLNEKEGH